MTPYHHTCINISGLGHWTDRIELDCAFATPALCDSSVLLQIIEIPPQMPFTLIVYLFNITTGLKPENVLAHWTIHTLWRI